MRKKQFAVLTLACALAFGTMACNRGGEETDSEPVVQQEEKEESAEESTYSASATVLSEEEAEAQIKAQRQAEASEGTEATDLEEDIPDSLEGETANSEEAEDLKEDALENEDETEAVEEIDWDPTWEFAEDSEIHTGSATLYRNTGENKKNITVCVNAGHGTEGGSSVYTKCHPDGSAKVTSGTTSAGSTEAVAVSEGMTFNDGTPESAVTLEMALKLKEVLLERGYDVLMIRESDDVQLDNVARTVMANNNADCHIALHWDSTESDKGSFFLSVPDVGSFRSMEPVASHYEEHDRLGGNLVDGLESAGAKIFSSGSMEMDLTQTSYSTIPSVDIELGDAGSDHSDDTLDMLAQGIADGVDLFFGEQESTEASTEDTEAEEDTEYQDTEEETDYEDYDEDQDDSSEEGDQSEEGSDYSDDEEYEGEYEEDYQDDEGYSQEESDGGEEGQ